MTELAQKSTTADTGPPDALAMALAYASRGWHVLPVGPDKRPLGGQGLSHATTDESVIRSWFTQWPTAGIAIACKPSKIVVLDLDVGHQEGVDGRESFDQARGAHPHGCGLIATTPKRGRHHVYSAPTNEEVSSTTGVLPGVDVKAGGGQFGGYFIVPSGTSDRTWEIGDPLDPGDLQPMPAWLLELARKPAHPPNAATAVTLPNVSALPDQRRAEILSALYSIPPSVGRAVWLQTIFAVHAAFDRAPVGAQVVEEWSAKTTKQGQYMPGEAADIYREAMLPWEARGATRPPLVDSQTLFALAMRHGWKAPPGLPPQEGSEPPSNGSQLPQPNWDPDSVQSMQALLVADDPINKAWKPLPTGLLSTPPPPRKWLLQYPTQNGKPVAPGDGDGLVPLGKVGIFSSAGGVGKTMALSQLAVSVATGRPWLGHFVVGKEARGKRVLLALSEEDDEEIHRRLYAVAEALGLSADERREVERVVQPLALAGIPCRLTSTDQKGVISETWSARVLRSRLGDNEWAALIFDPLARWSGGATDKDNEVATYFVQVCESLVKVTGATALVTNHSSKAARNEGGVDSRGATGITDGARWAATLRADKDSPAVFFQQVKSNYSRPMFAELRLIRDEGGVLRAATEDEENANQVALDNAKRGQLELDIDKVVAALRDAGTASSIDQIVALAFMNKDRGRVAVRTAIGRQRILQSGASKRPIFSVTASTTSPTTMPAGGEETPPIPPMGVGRRRPATEDSAGTATNGRPGRQSGVDRASGVDPDGLAQQAGPDDGLPEQSKGPRRRARRGAK